MSRDFLSSDRLLGGWVSSLGWGARAKVPGGRPRGRRGRLAVALTKRTPEHRGNEARARSNGKQLTPGNMSALCFLFRNLFPKCCGAPFRFR